MMGIHSCIISYVSMYCIDVLYMDYIKTARKGEEYLGK